MQEERDADQPWSRGARLACPEGTIMSTGVCFEDTSRAPATHSEAEDDCADEGMRLPSGGELTTFVELDGINLTSGHWTDDLVDIATSSIFKYFVVADPGNGVSEADMPTAYRCVAGAGIG